MKVSAVTVSCVLLFSAGAFAEGKNTPVAADSGNSPVQMFATPVVNDRSEGNTQLLALAHLLNITAPNSTLPMLETQLILAQKDLAAVSH